MKVYVVYNIDRAYMESTVERLFLFKFLANRYVKKAVEECVVKEMRVNWLTKEQARPERKVVICPVCGSKLYSEWAREGRTICVPCDRTRRLYLFNR